MNEAEFLKLQVEFYVDDHKYWPSQNPDSQQNPQLQQKWQDINESMETDLETFSKEASEQSGDFLEQIKIENRERQNYKDFLRKFSVYREETGVDIDTFDYKLTAPNLIGVAFFVVLKQVLTSRFICVIITRNDHIFIQNKGDFLCL